jgi:signal transduction histidine kinase
MNPSVLRVLVADDIAISRLPLCAMVNALGHESIGVEGGAAAVAQVVENPPDLLLLDLWMPDMDGFDVIGHVRSAVTQHWLPVIVISSLEGDEHFIEALRRGADDYLSRPINPALLEAKLRHYARVLGLQSERQRLDRMKDEFLATVSHELRTPLTSILGALGLLASGAAGVLPKAALPLAEVAKRNGERLSHLIDDILDLTKLEGNKMVLQMRDCSLEVMLGEAVAANHAYAERAGVRLQTDLATTTLQVRIDPERFLQIMANLLSNAIKHSAAGDVVTVKLLVQEDWLQVVVQDRGPGIDPEFRQRMFEKFSQADSSDRRAQGGTGLGLYITRILVERMGGRVWVDSVHGQGASFGVEFPLVNDSPENPQTSAWLLHIDCDVDARARVAQWLQGVCTIVGVGDLQQAHSLLTRAGAPIVLADPQAQGAAEPFCVALKKAAQGQRVLLYSDAIDDTFANRMGLAWLRKSATSRAALLAAVRNALESTPMENQR